MGTMENFPSNSKENPTAKPQPEKVIEKITVNEVIVRKKSLGKRFKETFLGGDLKTTAREVTANTIFPGLRNLVWDIGSESLRKMLFPTGQPRNRPVEYRSRVTYNTPVYRGSRDPRESRAYLPDQPPHVVRSTRRGDQEYICGTREEADGIIEMLGEIISQYRVATVADLHEMMGRGSDYVDHEWGWSTLGHTAVRQIREGYLLELPPLEHIQRG